MNEIDNQLMEEVLSGQIPEAEDNSMSEIMVQPKQTKKKAAKQAEQTGDFGLGVLNHMQHDADEDIVQNVKKFQSEGKLSRIGEEIGKTAEYAEGWIDVPRSVLGQRSKFYPEDWRFRVRPATVEAIRNWSLIDDENANSIDDVFNEIMKSCVSIVTPMGPLPWGNINSWVRFFFLLLVREYTFAQGETAIKYEEPCVECENDITFRLTSQSLMYEFPDDDIMNMFDSESKCWRIDPEEYDVQHAPVTLYLPTLEKDANIKKWLISRLQENRNRKIDQVFIKFLSWMAPKISKDETIAARQIKELERIYKSWDTEMFSFMDEVIRNIMVMPMSKLTTKCPICGEEVTSDIRFPNNVKSLFNVQNISLKFGTKLIIHL